MILKLTLIVDVHMLIVIKLFLVINNVVFAFVLLVWFRIVIFVIIQL